MCASEDMPDRESPPNITAWSSSVTVREKLTQGGGLDPFIEGENHNPRTQVILIILYESINQPINIHIMHNVDCILDCTHTSIFADYNYITHQAGVNTCSLFFSFQFFSLYICLLRGGVSQPNAP